LKNSVKVFSPGTVSNVGSGYDIMGFAFDGPGDILEIIIDRSGEIIIENRSDSDIPCDENNVIHPALRALLSQADKEYGARVIIHRKISPGSGIGSSAASSAGAVFGANALLGMPFNDLELIDFALQGEKLVSGQAHADNVAPCIMGGFTLVRSYKPLDVISIPYPADLYCSVVHPALQLKTSESRSLVKSSVATSTAVQQTGNASALIAGLILNDKKLIARSVVDLIAEPARKHLIPYYDEIKAAAISKGALAFNISGSGPSVFAFTDSQEKAENISEHISGTLLLKGIKSMRYASAISGKGVRII
jgi:homoserine kinase